jgi:Protein of unknown function (DUF3429)
MTRTVAPAAEWTGYLGLIPFVTALAMVAFAPGFGWQSLALSAAVAYGAAILTFVGAVHFGLALANRLPWSLTVVLGAVAPSIAGAVAVVVGGQRGLGLLVVSFGVFWLYEARMHGSTLPDGYLSLRRNLSMAVCALLALTLFAADSAGLR